MAIIVRVPARLSDLAPVVLFMLGVIFLAVVLA